MRAAILAILLLGCQAFVDSNIKHGLGAPCIFDTDCQGSSCVDKICTKACESSDDCPSGTECTSLHLCQIELRAGFLYTGDPAKEQWSNEHERGRQATQTALPYLRSEAVPNLLLQGDAANAIDNFVSRNASVLFINSPALLPTVSDKAKQYPTIQFLSCGAGTGDPNSHGYFGRLYQAWYLAGFTAGKRTSAKRLGMVATYVTPDVVRDVNAFTLGALAADPMIHVEVRFIGFYHDLAKPNPAGKSRERVLTDLLRLSGCDVIANHADNGIVVDSLEGTGVASIATNVADGCPKGSKSCLGSVYFNWAPLYTRILDELHASTFDGQGLYDSIQIGPDSSTVNFAVNTDVVPSSIAVAVGNMTADFANGAPTLAFKGPFCAATVQRDVDMDMKPDCVPMDQSLSDDDLNKMCWFVQGVIEKADPLNPNSADQAADVPNEGDCKH